MKVLQVHNLQRNVKYHSAPRIISLANHLVEWVCQEHPLTAVRDGAFRLQKIKETGPAKKLLGLEVGGDKLAPEKQALKIGSDTVGEVVAGFRSATLGRNLGYAWVNAPYFKDGTSVTLEIEGAETLATVVEMPFYDPEGRRMRI